MKNLDQILFALILSIMLCSHCYAQQGLINGYTPEDPILLDELPIMQINPASAVLTLPVEVDNSDQPYFPQYDNGTKYMFDQTGTGMCVYVSSIFYAYTYEYNRLKGQVGNTAQTRFAPNSWYNYHCQGDPGTPSDFIVAFKQMNRYGVMSEAYWGNLIALDYQRWQTGYDTYDHMIKHCVKSMSRIQISRSLDDLNLMKHYLHNHNEAAATGGVLTLGAKFWGPIPVILPQQSAHAGEEVKISIDHSGPLGHAVAVVGYSDEVKYDVNGDQQFTNNIDITGDNIVDLRDCEIGAIKAANGYALQSTDGFDWVLYRCLYDTPLFAFEPEPDYTILLKLKFKANVDEKDEVRFGIKPVLTACIPPPNAWTWNHIPFPLAESILPLPMKGADYINLNYIPNFGPIEYSVDLSKDLINNGNVGKVYLCGKNFTTPNPNDRINSFSIVDYRWNEEFEIECTENNVLIAQYPNYNVLSIEYDLIPHESPILTNTTFSCNKVSRFNPKVNGNASLNLQEGISVDMYNSTITLEQGSSLSLGNNVIIRGKRGTNKFIIKGNILPMGTNVKFEAEPGATLEVIYENPTVAGLLENCIFNNANLTAQGGTLTVKNSTFTLLPSNKVIVKPNSKLILDASLLTKSGVSMWQGIEVWGNSNQHQQTVSGQCAQGTVELKNNTIVENAYNGITNWNPNDWNSIGGIIKAIGSTLRNNRRSVEFMKYENFDPATGQEIDNLSSFSNCTFEINDQYPAGAAPYYTQVSLWYVKGVKFYGCDFLNNRAHNFTGYGIYSLDAGYKLLPNIGTSLDRSYFQNFEYGIYASNSETPNTVYVNYGRFTNNGKGISLLSVNNTVILNSLFEVGVSTSCPNQGTGISLNACSGYSIEKNMFTGGTAVPGTTYSGIEITNSGTAYNEIYHNNFQNLNYGNLANQVNGTSNTIPPTGLTYLCNINSGNKNDFYVTNNSRISYFQRSGSSGSAANSFSNNALYNFYNGGSTRISYYYSPGQAPLVYYNLLLVPTANTYGCPDHYGDGMGNLASLNTAQTGEKEQQYADAFSAYNNVKAIYESLKDGGNTANTIDEISTSIPSEMWELRDKLLGDSPHLSQTSLKEASLKTEVLPESVLFDILAANPDELRNEDFLDFLKTKEVPLPDYMIELLREISGNTSYKTILQEQLNMYDIQKSTAADDILRSELNDSILNQTNVVNWLDNKGDLASQYQMVDLWLHNGNIPAAQAILSTIPGLFQLSESEIADYQNFNIVKNIQFNLKNSDRNLFMLDSTEITSLTTIANSGKGIASAQAKGILGFTAGNQYCQCNQDDGLKHLEVLPKINASTATNIKITVSPNPATTWIAFDYTLPDSYPSANLSIYDNNGRLIDNVLLTGKQGQKVLNTRSYAPGTYIYNCDQIKKISGKFIIK